MYIDGLSDSIENFTDPTHLRPEAAREIFERFIFGSGKGRFVTPENVDFYVPRMLERIKETVAHAPSFCALSRSMLARSDAMISGEVRRTCGLGGRASRDTQEINDAPY
jgi:hypothetical protein